MEKKKTLPAAGNLTLKGIRWRTNLIREALNLEMPVMGICRGLQNLNVYFGGTLFIDLPTDLDTIVKHQLPETYNANHEVNIQQGSLLHEISGVTVGTTNSNHHQGIEILAYQLNGIATNR